MTAVYTDVFTEEIGDKLEEMVDKIKKSLSGFALQFYEKEFSFFGEITGISGKIRSLLVSRCSLGIICFVSVLLNRIHCRQI